MKIVHQNFKAINHEHLTAKRQTQLCQLLWWRWSWFLLFPITNCFSSLWAKFTSHKYR